MLKRRLLKHKYVFFKNLYVLGFFLTIHYGMAQDNDRAPDFTMTQLDGTEINLIELKNKVIYISFWASWCKPCLVNFEKYKDIRNKMEAEGIVLLNVSIDNSPDKWKSMVEKLDLEGLNVLASKDQLYPDYPISSIPLYEIVGKDGRFRYLSDEVGRDILAQFRKWVAEN